MGRRLVFRGFLGLLVLVLAPTARAVMDVPPVFVGVPDYPHSVETRRFVGIPSITRASNGRYWATWYASAGAGEDVNTYAVLATSADGDSWDEVFVADPDLYDAQSRRAFDPQVWVDPTGKLRWFWADRAGTGQSLSACANDGVWMMTIDDATSVPATPPAPRCIYKGVMLGKPFVLADGAWAFPIAQWKSAPSALLVVSTDQGATFSLRGGVTVPSDKRESDEHSIVETTPGHLRAWIRTFDGVRESVSTDNGVTWTEATLPATLRNAATRLSVTKLASGNLLLVKNGALAVNNGRTNLTAYVSTDGGDTWVGGLLLDSRNGATYPDVVQDPDGLIHVVYDQDRTGRREILMASFKEEDAAAGRETTTHVRFRQVVSGPVAPRRADAEPEPVGGALLGDHVADYSINSGISLSAASGYEYTLEAWVNPSAYDNENHIFGQYNGDGRMLLYIGDGATGKSTGRKLAAFFGAGGSASNQRFGGTTDIPLNAWTHVAMSVRRHEVRFYINGKLDGMCAFTPRGLPSNRQLSLGGISCSTAVGSGFKVFNGRLADLRAWGRARTEREIARDMGYRLNGTEQDLLGYWTMSGTLSNAIDNNVAHRKIVTPNAHLKVVPETALKLKPSAELSDTGCALRFLANSSQMITTDVKLGAQEPYTLEAWVRPLGFQDEGRIISIYQGGAAGRAIFETYKGKVGMYINASNGNKYPTVDFDLPFGYWSHVALSRSANVLKIYVNGSLARTVDDLSLVNTVNAAIMLGNCGGGLPSFNGDLRDLRVWNSARTGEQIAADRYRRLSGNEAGLKGLWLLDEGQGRQVSNRVTGVCSQISGTNWTWIAKGLKFPVQECETTTNRTAALLGGMPGNGVNTDLKMQNHLTWTWEAWINPSYFEPTDRNKIMTCFGSDNAIGRTAFCIINNTRLGLGRWVDGAVEGKSTWISGGYVPLNRWSHAAVTFDNGTVTLYLNGAQVAQDTGFALHAFPDSPVIIGGSLGWTSQNAFYGQIAEARVWSVARTQAEIAKDFNRPLRGTEPGLVGYWPLNEPAGATTAANLKRGGAAATATCFWGGAELVLDDPLPPGGTVILFR